MANSIWGNIAEGGTNLWGYNELLGNLRDDRAQAQDTISSLQDYVTEQGQFTPYGVTYGNEGVNMQLSPEQQAAQQALMSGGLDLFSRASSDPTARTQELYNLLQGSQAAGVQQDFNQLMAGNYAAGTGGMQTADYGGNPQSYAFAKALENQSTANMMAANQMALGEQAQYGQLGSNMFGQSYSPMNALLAQQQPAIANAELAGIQNRDMLGMFADLGLGGLATDLNYSGIEGDAFGDLIGASSGIAGGIAGSLGDSVGGWLEELGSDAVGSITSAITGGLV